MITLVILVIFGLTQNGSQIWPVASVYICMYIFFPLCARQMVLVYLTWADIHGTVASVHVTMVIYSLFLKVQQWAISFRST